MFQDDATERVHKAALSRLGRTLAGRFTLNRIIAIGGMATVYESTQAPLMRKVAVKVLHPTEIEAGRTDFFLREANAASALRHPNIISVVDFGQETDGTLFLAMEFVPGIDFGELLSQTFPLPPDRLIHIAEQICLALEVAHRAGVIHCDMKPSNIMVESVPGNPDFVKVVDFGISRVAVEDGDEDEDEEVLGSFYYMAPEQALGTTITPRTDIYGLGAVLYAALAGQVPFNTVDESQLLHAIAHDPPGVPSQLRPDLSISPGLEQIVLRAMAKDPAERFASAADMRQALRRLSSAAPPEVAPPDSLEILLDDDELFNLELPDGLDFELNLPADFDAALEIGADLDDPNLPAIELPPLLDEPLLDLAHVDTGELRPAPSTDRLKAGGRAPQSQPPTLLGREPQLKLLHEALQMTRRGALAVRVLGEAGAGRSFFLEHALRQLQATTQAVVLNAELLPGDRERPYSAIAQWVHAALAAVHNTPRAAAAGEELELFTSAPLDPLKPPTASTLHSRPPHTRSHTRSSGPIPTPLDAAAAIREELSVLRLAPLELETFTSLLVCQRRGVHPSDSAPWTEAARPFDHGPLRLPETRRHLLRFALEALLRALMEHAHIQDTPQAPIILVLDGWEHCDSATRRILRKLVNDAPSLPLLLLATLEANPDTNPEPFPEEPYHPEHDPTQPRWFNDAIAIPPLSPQDVEVLLRGRLGYPPHPELVMRLHALSGGYPLLLKELLQSLSAAPNASSDAIAVLHQDQLPESLNTLLGQQIDQLSHRGKMLLAICAILGHTFPTHLLKNVLPADFDIDGTLAELIGSRILEPIAASHDPRLRFRIPLMRALATRRMNPARTQQLHLRVAAMLQERPQALPRAEAEVWLALHATQGGEPLQGLDHLLEAADAALERWEPELAIRRFRQILRWLLLHPQPLPATLLLRQVRAHLGLLKSARRLGFKPREGDGAAVPEPLPHEVLALLQSESGALLPPRLRAEAALETGRYLASIELHQGARAALQLALRDARAEDDPTLLVEVELHLARTLLNLQKAGLAADVAAECLTRLRSVGPPPPLQDASLSLRTSQPLALLAEICVERQKFALADDYLTQARRSAEADADLDRLHEIHTLRARLAHLQSRHAETAQALETAREFAFRAHDLRAQARILFNLGVTLALAGNAQRAQQQLRVAAVIARALAWKDFITLVDDQLKRLA